MKFKTTNSPKWLTKYVPSLNKAFDKYFENLLGDSWVSVNFVTKEKIQDLNAKFNKLAKSTDVLSFPFTFVDTAEPFIGADTELGEVYISEDIVKKNAKEYKVDEKEETIRVFIHGALHILGYVHEGDMLSPQPEDKEMFEMQEFLIKEILSK
jgi:probable rRNA maturation factor